MPPRRSRLGPISCAPSTPTWSSSHSSACSAATPTPLPSGRATSIPRASSTAGSSIRPPAAGSSGATTTGSRARTGPIWCRTDRHPHAPSGGELSQQPLLKVVHVYFPTRGELHAVRDRGGPGRLLQLEAVVILAADARAVLEAPRRSEPSVDDAAAGRRELVGGRGVALEIPGHVRAGDARRDRLVDRRRIAADTHR